MEWGVGARGVSGDALSSNPAVHLLQQPVLLCLLCRAVDEVGIGKQSNWIGCELPLIPPEHPFIPICLAS